MKIMLLFVLLFSWGITMGQANPFYWTLTTNQPSVGTLYETIIKTGYLKDRKLRVWIPAGYAQSKKRFNVVYFHDGQMLFDSTSTWNHQSWDLVRAAKRYLHRRAVILVGIDNDPEHRYAEFFPAPIFPSLPTAVQFTLRDSLWNGLPRFDSYANALISDVFPLIERSWNVNPGGENRTMVGSSMGGIVSLTFLLTHPNELSSVACLSMHLPLINEWKFKDRYKEPLSTAFNRFIQEKGESLYDKSIYIDRGDQSLDAVYVKYFPGFEVALNPLKKNNHVWLRLIKNSGHSERDWAKRIGPILKLVTK
jgi:enterochelin esterase-like enzyme